MPTWNRAHLMAESIESIIKQNFKNWELIVVDDGSTDSTKDLMDYYTKLDKRIKYFKKKHEGISKTRNFAVSKAKGDILVCTDSDDLNDYRRLRDIHKYFKQHPSVDIVYSGWDICDDGLNIKVRRRPFNYNPFALLDAQYIAQPTLAFKKEVAKKIPYNEKLKAGEDWEWLLECTVKKFKFGIVKKPLVSYREHRESISVIKRKEVNAYDKKMIKKYKPLIEKIYAKTKFKKLYDNAKAGN